MSRNILVNDTTVPENDASTEEQETLNSQETVEPEVTPVPDKYQGKSLDDVIQMHVNAEKEIGRQANEVGTYRDLLTSMGDAQTVKADTQTDATEEVKPVEVTSDDLWDNPTDAIKSVVQDVVKDALAPMTQQQEKNDAANQLSQLAQEHPDAEQIGADPAFGEWVANNEFRLQDANRWMESQDINAARRLISDYKEVKGIKPQEETPVVETQESAVNKARAVATETGRGGGGPTGAETLSKRETMKVFINDRDLYDSDSYQKNLIMHARRGTLVD